MPPPPGRSLPVAATSTVGAKVFFGGQGSAAGARQLCEEGGGRPALSSSLGARPSMLRRSSRSSSCQTSWRASLLRRSSLTECASLETRSTLACRSSSVEAFWETCFATSSCFIPDKRKSELSNPMLSSRPRITPSMLSIWSSSRFTIRVVPSRLRCSMHFPSFCTPRPWRRIARYLLLRSTSPRISVTSMLSLSTIRWE
mmetsp:Transcript_60460/g.129685  ORF Transcript_60460/g.129685 Transcript_60460/m.129685 type:complete len:200 (+) Transcript_60460:466-1065(+)